MPQLGSLGDVVFEVSEETVRTFDEFVQTSAGRWVVHEPIKSQPKTEFLGPAQGQIEFTIRLSAALGVDPRDEKKRIEKMAREGKHAPLMIAMEPISNCHWYVERCETTYIWVNGQGQLEYADMHLTVREYF